MTTTATYGTLSASEHSTQLRKAVIASTVGTAISGTTSSFTARQPAHFRQAVFSQFGSADGDARRLRNLFHRLCRAPDRRCDLGHYGDRIGRKATLIATLLCMGIATFLIAFVPTYETVGIWGAVILTVLRMISGHRRRRRMGRVRSVGDGMVASPRPPRPGGVWPQFGVPCGLLLANLATSRTHPPCCPRC